MANSVNPDQTAPSAIWSCLDLPVQKLWIITENSNGFQERQENMIFLDKLEQQMRDNLSSDVRLMNDLQATKKLAELKKQYDETIERLVPKSVGPVM